ncbi:winged helix-turn-helix domain-containing protein [Maritimibacter sp. HL-12]|uniref:winged helix-turn-helix domain-containing protein n=1 Tax=Maritimibacter sp. HL-12 TaxID=1162418 RepID=UPI000A0F2136|nr:response regulator transcription factor [Maritimibacter sp. HL-12]SMH46927.1 two-component system, OmpR family, phosphate regulon response regulator OmpR [Maritimibacter sp. HL-12]
MSEPTPAHLLVAEGDARLSDLLRQYLKSQGFLVSVARDADHASRLLAGLEFDLILLDDAMPGAERLSPDGLVLHLVPGGGKSPGVKESLAKPFEPKALCEKINAILDRRPPPAKVTAREVRMGELRFDIEAGRLTRAGAPLRLTATEVQLLRALAADLGKPLGRGELVARLGREGLQAKARAVDVQITRLRRKLEADPKSPRHLQTVRGAGYMLVGD